jgi:alpha-glucosidase (family GH31 glycosyl hydrolase)
VSHGGQAIEVDVPLDVIPVFARDGKHHDVLGRI